jgi:hypothetical protein
MRSIKKYQMNDRFKEFNKKMAFKLLEKSKPDEQAKLKVINSDITKLKEKKKNLLDLRLEGEIDKNIYNEKLNDITFKINKLENQKNKI